MTRAVFYTRVSKDELGRGKSVGEQEAELRAFAAEESWSIEAVFSDNDRSASVYATKDRPGLAALERYLLANPVDVLAIWEASRLARSMAVGIYFRDLCRKSNVAIWFGERLYSMHNAEDQKSFTDALADAEHESAKASKRIRRSTKARAAEGRPHGRAQFGYTRIYDPVTKELIEVTENAFEADLLREMAGRVLAGESCYSIANDLTARSIKPPRAAIWYPTNVARLLKNPAYAGKRTHNGAVVSDAVWPAIFDHETWTRLQVVLGDPSRLNRHEGGAKYLLSGLALCGVCGGRIATMKQRGGYRTYGCRGVPAEPGQPVPVRFCTTRKVDDVDAWVSAVVIERLSRPDALSALARNDEDSSGELVTINDEIAALNDRLTSFYDAAAEGEITPAALARIEPKLTAEIATLEARRRDHMTPTVLREIELTDVAAQWETWPLITKRAIIRELFVIKLHKTGVGRRTFDPSKVTVDLAAG